jgi:hypothetical protein
MKRIEARAIHLNRYRALSGHDFRRIKTETDPPTTAVRGIGSPLTEELA